MKRVLALVVVLALTTLSALADGYFSGAWYHTKAPRGQTRGAGQMNLVFYDDFTVESDIYFDGRVVNHADGTWYQRAARFGGGWVFKLRMLNGSDVTISFSGVMKNDFASGTFKAINTSYSGRFQAEFISIDGL